VEERARERQLLLHPLGERPRPAPPADPAGRIAEGAVDLGVGVADAEEAAVDRQVVGDRQGLPEAGGLGEEADALARGLCRRRG
jgi:hypothetical protein